MSKRLVHDTSSFHWHKQMNNYPSDVAFTPAVKNIQRQKGSRSGYEKMEQRSGWQTEITPELQQFLSELDMFYLGTSNASGQPYIQYRGGAPGFLKPIDRKTLAFADFGGNRQYITLGNLSENPKAFIFLIDYVNSRRIKIWGKAKVVEDDLELLRKLSDADYPGKVERAIVFEIEAWDINCPQHIHKRIPQTIVADAVSKLQNRIAELESELESLKNEH